jgi:nitrate reductase gamma subunit
VPWRGQAGSGAGAVAPLETWFTLGAGLLCVLAGAGLLARRAWAIRLASANALATVAAFVALRFHILQGGACETCTIAAMMLRMVIWQATWLWLGEGP